MAERAQPRPCSACERESTELETCDGCLSKICARCYPAHKLPRKCELLEARRQLRFFEQSAEMKRRIRAKGKEWRLANEIMNAKLRNLESQQARIVEDIQGKMSECKLAVQFVHERVDILDKKEVTDLPGWIKNSSLHHIQDENEGMLETVERITYSLLETMRNLPGRLAENSRQHVGVVEKVTEHLDQCIRILQGVYVDQEYQDQAPARRQDEEPETRNAGTQTGGTRGQDDFTQTDQQVQQQFTQTDTHGRHEHTKTDMHGEDKCTQTETGRRDNWTQTGRWERFTEHLLPSGLVFLLVLLVAVALSAILRTGSSGEPAPGKNMTPDDYRRMRMSSVIKLSEQVGDLSWIHDTATCPVTGRVYIIGERTKDDRVVILVFDRDMTFINHFTTDIHTGYIAFISVSPGGELLVTTSNSNQISFLDGAGRLVRRVETGSRCGRCVSDGHRLYVSHPDLNCVTVLDDQGRQIRQIGGDELRDPDFLTIHKSHLYVSDWETKSIHVFTTAGDRLRRISTAGHVTEIMWLRGVHVDSAGHVLLVDRNNKRIHVYGEDGTWIHTLTDDRIRRPPGLGLTLTPGGDLVLVNSNPPTLFIFKTNLNT